MILDRDEKHRVKKDRISFIPIAKQSKEHSTKPTRLEIPSVEKHKEYRNTLLEVDVIANFGKRAQALLGGYDFSVLQDVIQHKAFENLQDFQDSKPSVNRDSIKIYSYRTNVNGPLNTYQCVWYKFKSPEVIDSKLPLPKIAQPVDPKQVLELAFQEARKLNPNTAALLDAKGYTFTFDSEDKRTGFNWIASDITVELKDRHLYIKTPTLITNRYVPVFGGMSYCKVFTPEDAAIILQDLAEGVFEKSL